MPKKPTSAETAQACSAEFDTAWSRGVSFLMVSCTVFCREPWFLEFLHQNLASSVLPRLLADRIYPNAADVLLVSGIEVLVPTTKSIWTSKLLSSQAGPSTRAFTFTGWMAT